jgi:hypothetical protein
MHRFHSLKIFADFVLQGVWEREWFGTVTNFREEQWAAFLRADNTVVFDLVLSSLSSHDATIVIYSLSFFIHFLLFRGAKVIGFIGAATLL